MRAFPGPGLPTGSLETLPGSGGQRVWQDLSEAPKPKWKYLGGCPPGEGCPANHCSQPPLLAGFQGAVDTGQAAWKLMKDETICPAVPSQEGPQIGRCPTPAWRQDVPCRKRGQREPITHRPAAKRHPAPRPGGPRGWGLWHRQPTTGRGDSPWLHSGSQRHWTRKRAGAAGRRPRRPSQSSSQCSLPGGWMDGVDASPGGALGAGAACRALATVSRWRRGPAGIDPAALRLPANAPAHPAAGSLLWRLGDTRGRAWALSLEEAGGDGGHSELSASRVASDPAFPGPSFWLLLSTQSSLWEP